MRPLMALIPVLMLWLPIAAQAQDSTHRPTMQPRMGTLLVGGSFGIQGSVNSYHTGSHNTSSTRELNLVGGIFLAPKFAIAGSFLWSNTTFEESDATLLGGSLGVRLLVPMGARLFFNSGIDILLHTFEDQTKVFQTGLRLIMGLWIPLNAHLALDVGAHLFMLLGNHDSGGETELDYQTAGFSLGYFGIAGTFDP